MMKAIVFSTHALEQMADRGAKQSEVEIAINECEENPCKTGAKGVSEEFFFQCYVEGTPLRR
jgi:hypothetical protein